MNVMEVYIINILKPYLVKSLMIFYYEKKSFSLHFYTDTKKYFFMRKKKITRESDTKKY